jgi:predicted Na+-dependent transporter
MRWDRFFVMLLVAIVAGAVAFFVAKSVGFTGSHLKVIPPLFAAINFVVGWKWIRGRESQSVKVRKWGGNERQ